MDITRLNQRNKCVFSIKLAEKASLYLQESEVDTLINRAISLCWKWFHTEEKMGQVLYDFLDNEENGFTLFQEVEEDEKKINAWNCIIDAIAYISKMAYEKEGAKYLPEPIEIVDDNTLIHMTDSLILCNDNEREYVKDVYKKCV